MQDITLQTYLKGIDASTEIRRPASTEKPDGKQFGQILKEAVDDVNNQQLEAEDSVRNLLSGKSGNLHETAIALEKAEISFKLMVQVKNKVLEAYQEIMRMQV